MDKKLIGYILMFVSVIFASSGNVFTKIIQQTMSIESGSFYWFMSTFLWSTLLLIIAGKQKQSLISIKKYWKKLSIFGILHGVGLLLIWYSIQAVGASSTSFLQRTGTIFLVLLGILFLKEKFNKLELVGMLMAIIGVLAFTYSPTKIFEIVSLYGIIGTLAYSLGQFIAKKEIKKIEPLVFVFVRSLLTFMFFTAYVFAVSRPTIPGTKETIILITIPLIVSVLQFLVIYKAFQYIEISKSTIIQSLTPIMVWILAWFLLRETLTTLQILGGALILIGVAVMVFFKNTIKRKSK